MLDRQQDIFDQSSLIDLKILDLQLKCGSRLLSFVSGRMGGISCFRLFGLSG